MHSATFRFTVDDVRALYLSVCQEMGDVGDRSSVRVRLEGADTLVLEVTAADIPALRAALNTWLRLINIAIEMREIVVATLPSRVRVKWVADEP
ncbi:MULTISPECIES: KEOPS complex subunit Pcc1 [unclassified Methanoculleus]|jgi:KEOPS complex subunit Pcc1|uniref:KEOPS complex subunit Pcc1 n=1 Tax=unclassified Methanoculleus TaxID=2619537 RepID=UPI0025CF2FAF|nr:KEOPS complex subunit Pcc1 [Methanoculleus sp. UBA377]MDD2473328.1 KEOPS complex subunit Pcc1 [Methanoculleus sp.]